MVILLFVIGIAAILVGVWLCSGHDTENLGVALSVIGAFIAIIALIAGLIIIEPCITSTTVDERVAMYQEENAKIEQQIADVVAQYQEHEKDIFTEVSPESAMTLVALYPELKSDSLVASQIDIYVKNNEKIKELKVQQINRHLYRWWLYFGK